MERTSQKYGAKQAVVINDNAIQRKIFSLRMSKLGFQCRLFCSAEEALATMPSQTLPDIVITDLYMPGLDGWKLCRLLRSSEYPQFNDIPLLVISGTFAGEDAERITSDTGADAFMPLPLSEAELLDVVTRLINEKGSSVPNRTPLLLVEDSTSLKKLLGKSFNKNGYITETATTLAEAQAALKEKRFTIAIIDFILPDGQGDQLLPIIKSDQPDCVSIMITADPSPDLAVQWMRQGAAAYLRKPFDAQYLLEVCIKARRERSFLRVEELLEQRTRKLQQEEIKNRLLIERREALLKKKSEERRLLLDTIPNMVWYLSSPEIYGPVNMPYARFLGRHPKDVAYANVADILSKEKCRSVIENNRKVFESGEPTAFESWMTDSHGQARLFSIIKTPKLNEDDIVEFVVCSGTDITDQRRAMEDRLKLEKTTFQIEKRDSLKQMAGAVAHNFNNILSAVMGNLELAMMDTPAIPSSVLKDIKASMKAAEKAAELSRLMLIYLGQTIGHKQKMDLTLFCQGNRSLIESNIPETVSLEMTLIDTPLWVKADGDQLLMALMNLVTNAWESMDGIPGTLTLRVGRIAASSFNEVNLYPPEWHPEEQRYAYIEIEDSGCGMTREALDKIFDPFFSTKFTGRGVGLSVVSGIAKAHNGAVSVHSSENFRGSTFRLYLPLMETITP